MKQQFLVNIKVHNNLRKLRELRKLSQEEVARRSQISWSTYQRIEAGVGNPSILTACLIARALNETVDRVFYVKEEKTK